MANERRESNAKNFDVESLTYQPVETDPTYRKDGAMWYRKDESLLKFKLNGTVNGIAMVGTDGKLLPSQTPDVAITDVFVVGSEAAMLALSATVGDVAVRTDIGKTFILASLPPTILANWQEIVIDSPVTSVNGELGDVVLDSDDVDEGIVNLYFTNTRAQGAITGGASTIVTADLAVDRALQSNGTGKVEVSTVTSAELAFLSGVTSAVQTQIDGKADASLPQFDRIGLGMTADSGAVMAATGQYYSLKHTTTTTLDWNNGNTQYIVLANNGQTFTFANPKDGARYALILKQPASGAAGTVTFPAEVIWPGGVTPILSTTNEKTDVITFLYDGTNNVYYAGYTLNY